jgi:16S rRNA (adenine1518-N6/adenine1519-N6)-dimethyltransferase
MKFFDDGLPISDITVMVQREVADRLCAQVGDRSGSAVTVAVNYYAQAEKQFNVSRGSFMPSPNVDSAVIKLTLRDKPAVDVDKDKFFKLVKSAFAQRRKTVLNSVSSGMGIPKEQVSLALESSGLSPTVRAEQLTMDEFATLCSNL